jgi:hypothetical protein
MKDSTINEGVEESGESIVKDHGFAAVPIHFNPKEGAEKQIALVIPGIEPPLAFFRISGDSPESLVFEEIDGHVESVSEGSKDEEQQESVDTDTSEVSESEAVEEQEDKSEDDIEEEVDDETIEYPHVDENDNPVAGFLLGSDENQPLVVLVTPQDGESIDDAMKRVGDQHPEHIPSSLAEAEKALGKSPLSGQDV